MSVQLSPSPFLKFFDNNGEPLAFGTVGTFVAGTSTPQATWVDSTQTTQNTNPVVLDARGEANIWLDPTLSYKYVLADSAGNQIKTTDNIRTSLAGPMVITAPSGQTPLTIQTNGAGNLADLLITGSVNGGIFAEVINTNSGTAATAELVLENGTHVTALEMLGVNNVEGEYGSWGTNSKGLRFGFAFGAAGFINNPSGSNVNMTLLGATAGAQVDMTPDTATFTLTAVGISGSPTATASWYRIGKQVSLFIPAISGTSTSTSFTFTGLPAAIQPATIATQTSQVVNVGDNGVTTFNGQANINSGSGTITWLKAGASAGWTASGTKAAGGFTMTYLLL